MEFNMTALKERRPVYIGFFTFKDYAIMQG